jgi:leucyl-tRNA synthetase
VDDYDAISLESKCQKFWADNDVYHTSHNVRPYYILTPLQTPSLNGPHLAEQQPYIAADVIARYYRATGHDVLFPIGYNVFAPQNEVFAEKAQHAPQFVAQDNLQFYSETLSRMGYSCDFSRELDASHNDYIKAIQHLFGVLWSSYFDSQTFKTCHIRTLPIPQEIQESGEEAITAYQNSKRLIYSEKTDVFYSVEQKRFYNDWEVQGQRTKEGGVLVRKINSWVWKLRTKGYAARLNAWLPALDWPGEARKSYDWEDVIISGPNYWGIPIPLIYEVDDSGQVTDKIEIAKNLPVCLPDLFGKVKYPEDGIPVLEKEDDWLYGIYGSSIYKRESMVISHWFVNLLSYVYFANEPITKQKGVNCWFQNNVPVSLYISNSKIQDVLYMRFIHKVLYDHDIVQNSEPISMLFICGDLYRSHKYTGYKRGNEWVSADLADETCTEVGLREDQVTVGHLRKYFLLKEDHSVYVLDQAGVKVKSGGNIININKLIDLYGAESLRFFLLSIPEFSQDRTVDLFKLMDSLNFLRKAWQITMELYSRLSHKKAETGGISDIATSSQKMRLNIMLKKISQAIESLQLHKGCQAIVEFIQWLGRQDYVPLSLLQRFMVAIHPYLPHLSEALWGKIGGDKSITSETYPKVETSQSLTHHDLLVVVNETITTHLFVPKSARFYDIKDDAIATLGADFNTDRLKKVSIIPGERVEIELKEEEAL